MTTVYLIRHAEAEGNVLRRAQGHWNGSLTERGKKQLISLKERFSDIKIAAVYASALDRAQDTAAILCGGENHPEFVLTEPNLIELNLGVWESQSWDYLRTLYPTESALLVEDPASWSVQGSEDFKAAAERMYKAISGIAEKHEGKTIAIVSHGMAIRAFLTYYMHISPAEKSKLRHGDNTSVTLAYYDNGEFNFEYYNDAGHLSPEISTFYNQRELRKLDVYIKPLDLNIPENASYYINCYRNSWIEAHGSDRSFFPSAYLSSAKSRIACGKGKVFVAGNDASRYGILELDRERESKDKMGLLSLIYVEPEYRRSGLGLTLIGCAEAYFANLKREKLFLHVAVTNISAIKFYENAGFDCVERQQGAVSALLRFEKRLK
ncbi:MAG: GNAT family N-acetyltransferase [Ruminococcaceae bacterium]|nr:GNAT family N-acetyltransferase [Oscillospiraceae bacterium]